MTIRERETLQSFANKGHACGTLYEIVAILASVALKEEQIRMAQAAPGSLAIAKCARCSVDLFPGDDFWMREEDRVSACWRQAPEGQKRPGAPCFRDRLTTNSKDSSNG